MAEGFAVDIGADADDVEIIATFLRQAITFSRIVVEKPLVTAENFGIRVQFVRGQVDRLRLTATEVGNRASKEVQNFEARFRDNRSLEGLGRAGLLGLELRTKMSVLNEWSTHFFDNAKSSINALRRVLDNAISILGSISSEIPGFEFFKEMYELIKNSIEAINHSRT